MKNDIQSTEPNFELGCVPIGILLIEDAPDSSTKDEDAKKTSKKKLKIPEVFPEQVSEAFNTEHVLDHRPDVD